ncbi:hypothetical protein L210DRAFT_3033086 [Boletus edulis BED1]|uniref:Uncharacterized protein n=1 Tax=Boletus edulis BED1 TaxID=1328754 RepID=A0AAD4BZR1_BOLED|nr:hypothetical protein L210DRAFT_3033086 [Boletus edulis BED1]
MLASCLDDVKKKAEEEATKLRADSTNLQRKLGAAQKDGEEVQRTAEEAQDDAENLASTTVTTKAHASLKEEHPCAAIALVKSRAEARQLGGSSNGTGVEMEQLNVEPTGMLLVMPSIE